ncbi:MAG TPA: 1,4-alpha-glucan branching enzyme, partial [Stellaceae bacterium]|nr:1,4-alpha-glucan branching enzyme [Stellaceae bacterium]
MLPGAQDVSVIESATGKVAAKAAQIHRDGLFVATIPDRKEPFRYRLRVSSRGAQHEFYDIYSFSPVLGEIDIHLLAEGNHLASYQKLGAHPLV